MTILTFPRGHAPMSPEENATLRTLAEPGAPVFLTVHDNGRRRYSHWIPYDPATGRGNCYAALPTEACDALHAAGRIALGPPLRDQARTTYQVRVVERPAAGRRLRAVPAA
ncbi:hypothetical protein [Streptomyces sp. NPDC060194]|uniref:hypothetical protein n=1 Tax=Streptomyces sp. NPDC060194 TaxID=3347069 RepID=UPI00364868AD